MTEKMAFAQSVPPSVTWRDARGSRRVWLTALAALLVLGTLYSFFSHPIPSMHVSDALLDTVMNETLGVSEPSSPPRFFLNSSDDWAKQFQKIFVINLHTQRDRQDRMLLAAKLSGIKVEFIDAVTTDQVDDNFRNIVPPADKGFDAKKLKDKAYASWRSHVNAIKAIVEQDLGSALILEDDADWDVRLKTQLRDWAIATRQLVQPRMGTTDQYLDPTYSRANYTKYNEPIQKGLNYTEWDIRSPPGQIVPPTDCAYGDLSRWDVLWAGHCGQRLAMPGSECLKTPLGRVAMFDDETAVSTQHFANYWSGSDYKNTYKNHTRLTSWSCAQVCNTAYAISNQGAKRLFYDYSMKRFDGMADAMLRQICDGTHTFDLRTCLSVTPPLFNQYARKGSYFDITPNIRWSTLKNIPQLTEGSTNFIESWPDNSTKRGH